jgi:hypothetical protein
MHVRLVYGYREVSRNTGFFESRALCRGSCANGRLSIIVSAGTRRSVDLFPFPAAVIPSVSFIEGPYDDDHQRTDDLAFTACHLVADLSQIGRAVTRSLAIADPVRR